MTATLVSVPMALGRIVLSFLVSLLLGTFLNAMERRRHRLFASPNAVPRPDAALEYAAAPSVETRCSPGCCAGESLKAGAAHESKTCCADEDDCCGGADAPNESRLRRFVRTFLANLRSLWILLLAGLLVAATLSVLIPQETLHKYLQGGWTGYLAAVAVGIPVYVCDGGEIPLTRALLEMGVGIGPAFCFMLASVGTCLPTITMATRIIGGAATAIYLVAWLILSVGGGMLMATVLH